MTDWEIQSGKPQCEGCNTGFLNGQPTHCLLVLDRQPLLRQDFCRRCWEQSVVPKLGEFKEYATWTGIFKVYVPPPKEEIIKKDHAEVVFRRLLSSLGQDPAKKNILFVLAAMLERKKILKQQKVVRSASESPAPASKKVYVYSHAQTGESILIEDPQIRLSDWDKIQGEVRDLLNQELAHL